MAARQRDHQPIGLSLEFDRGRGFLCAEDEHWSDGLVVERLRMEIPDLEFPLDVSRGLAQFRDRRCLLTELALCVEAASVARWVSEVAGFEVLDVAFERGRFVIEWRSGRTLVTSFAVVGDVWPDGTAMLRLSDGAAPLAERLVAALPFGCELVDEGLVEVRPVRLVLAALFAMRGWKLPNIEQIDLAELNIEVSGFRIATAPRGERVSSPSTDTAERRAGRPSTDAAERRAGRPSTDTAERRAGRPSTDAAERRAGRPSTDTAERRAGRPSTERAAGRPSAESTLPMAALSLPEVPDFVAAPQITNLDDFRRKLDDVQRKPAPLDDLDDGAMATILRRPRGASATNAPPPAGPSLADARKSGEPGELADALEHELEHGELDEAQRLELAYELGELAYYDLEDNGRALPWLQYVRDADPDGYGARPGVLNAIEAIYEEEGSVDGQVEILRTKLERAESIDMADTYRLLLAQLEWEERRDPKRAKAWLEPVLERDALHEGALRLLADIAIERENWEEAAQLLKDALSVAGDGLDSLELERKLARLLLDHLDRPDEAAAHFQHVLDEAPGDAAAMSALRDCQAAVGDWAGYAAALATELGLLLGRLDVDGDAWLVELTTDVVPKPLRMTASHIIADIAAVYAVQLDDGARACELYVRAVSMWPENVEALKSLIALEREAPDAPQLSHHLAAYAAFLLDPAERYDALVEAGRHADDVETARDLFERAVDAAAELAEPPPDLEAVLAIVEN